MVALEIQKFDDKGIQYTMGPTTTTGHFPLRMFPLLRLKKAYLEANKPFKFYA